jgi:hypothetical protein
MEQTGEPYMAARRQLLEHGDGDPEPYYVLSRRYGVVRVEEGRRRQVERPTDALWMVDEPGAWWGYGGSGPGTTAKVLLDDACSAVADLMESQAFASEVLARLDVDASEERLTVAEVRAWWNERRHLAVAEARAESGRVFTPDDQREMVKRMLFGPVPEGILWLERRREAHPPRFA